MKKEEYVDFIRGIVDPSGKNPRFHPKQVEYAIEMVYNQLTMNLNPNEYDNIDFLTKEYTAQTCTLDATTNRYYVALPAPVVPLRIPSEAIRHINTNQGTAFDFCPATETIWEIIDGLFSNDIDTTIPYIVRYNRVWFGSTMTAAIAAAGVRMVVAVTFSTFDYTEDVNLTIGGVDLVQAAVQMLMNTQPMNLKNDNK